MIFSMFTSEQLFLKLQLKKTEQKGHMLALEFYHVLFLIQASTEHEHRLLSDLAYKKMKFFSTKSQQCGKFIKIGDTELNFSISIKPILKVVSARYIVASLFFKSKREFL